MARAAMGDIINFVERLVNDSGNAIWLADEIEATLDQNRIRVNQEKLVAEPTRSASDVEYLAYSSPYQYWESDVVLESANYATLTPDTSYPLLGRWEFDAEPDWPVYVTGYTYDVYAAAADLLEERALQLATQYDFSADGGQFMRSQQRKGYLEMAAKYRGLQRPKVVRQIRDDVNVW